MAGFLKDKEVAILIYNHPTKKGTVEVPNHGMNTDLKPGTANNILKQAGLK